MQVIQFGLGTMGLPMAKTLLAEGVDLVATDAMTGARDAFAAAGGRVEPPDEIDVSGAAVILTMLPEGSHVRSVYDTILSSVQPDAVLLDCSTIDVATAQELASRARARGAEFVDAPVSGGPEGAGSGSLSFMVGGSPAALEQVRPLLGIMGQRITVFGDAGMGQAAKACHNMIVGITGLAVFEGFALAEALGLNVDDFHGLCSTAAAACWTLDNRCPSPGVVESAPSSNDYRPGFAARLMAKDLRLAQEAADAAHLETVFGRQAAERFTAFVDAGNGDLDYSAIYRTLNKHTKDQGASS